MKNPVKSAVKTGIFILFAFVFRNIAGAQCSFELNVEVIQHSTCVSNGIVEVTLSGDEIDLSNVLIILTDGRNINKQSTKNGYRFEALPPGDYSISAQSVCKNTQSPVTETAKVTVLSEYEGLNAALNSDRRGSLNCINSGMVSMNVYAGRPPYKIEMTSKPEGYVGETVFEYTLPGNVTFDGLAPGDYVFVVSDACSYKRTIEITVEKIDSDFPSDPYGNFYPSGCSGAYADENPYETNVYWQYYRDRYEIAFTFDDTKEWKPATYAAPYTGLPKTYKEMYAEGATMKVYLRLKDTECEQLVDEIQFSEPSQPTVWSYTEKSCNSYKLSFYYDNEYLLCSPFSWEILDENGARVAGMENIDNFYTQTAENLLYNQNYTLKVTDSNGTEVLSTFYYEREKPSIEWEWISRYSYTYDYNYDVYNICVPYKIEVHDADGVLAYSDYNVTNTSGTIPGLEYGKEYTVKIFDDSGNEIIFPYFVPAPDKSVSSEKSYWLYRCGEYSAIVQILNMFPPYTWTVTDQDGNTLQSGTVEEEDCQNDGIENPDIISFCEITIQGLKYGVTHTVKFTDGVTEVSTEPFTVDEPPLYSFFYPETRDYDFQCNDYALDFWPAVLCYPYRWEVFDGNGVSVYSESGIDESQTHTVRLQYDIKYTVRVTDSRDRTVELEWTRSDDYGMNPYIYSWYSDQQCHDYGYSFSVYNVNCFPYRWEVSDSDGNSVAGEGGFNEMLEHTVRLEYNKDYTVKIIDSKGKEASYSQRLNRENVALGFGAYSYMSNCASESYRGYMYISGSLYGTTRIRFVSGPQTPVHEDAVLEEDLSYFYPFSQDYRYAEHVPIAVGEYVFEVTDRCGDVHTVNITHSRYLTAEGFSYSLDETTEICSGITRLYPTGKVYRDGYPSDTYFYIIESPEGTEYFDPVGEGGYFPLSKNGRYVIGIRNWWRDCDVETLTVDYVNKTLALDGHSSYVCTVGKTGQIRVQAKYGKPPYTYTLLNEDLTPVEGIAPNDTGDFEYGAFGERYVVLVQDACKSEFPIEVLITTLDQSTLISAKPDICKGETLELNSLLLGASVYEWSGPLDFFADTRNASIPDVTSEHSGPYWLRVQPAGCDVFFKHSIDISVHDTPVPVVGSGEFCQAEAKTQLYAQPLEEGKYSIQWYDENEELLPEAPLIDLNGEIREYVFYVTQTEDALGCVSEKQKVEVRIHPLPEKNANASGWSCANGHPGITVTDVVAGYVYTVFADAEATDLIMTFTGTEDGTMTVTLPVTVTEDTDFYLQTATASAAHCTLTPDIVKFHVDVDKLEILPDVLPVYVHGVPYSVQIESNAKEPVFSYTGDLVTGISMDAGGLISGTVPVSAGFVESTFTVTVTDKNGCQIAREYTLRSCDPAPEILQAELSYCQNAQSVPLEALSPNGFPLQWYDAEMKKLDEAPSPNTAVAGEQIFYVSQINGALQCESGKAEIKVQITPLPEPDFEASGGRICYGSSPVISLAKLNSTYTYDIYADIQMTEKLASVKGKESGDVSLSTVPEPSTSYYISVTDNLSCTSKNSLEVEIDVIKLEILPDALPVYAHDVPYSVQLESNAEEPVFSHTGSLVTGIGMDASGLISGTVPESAGREESTFTVTVTDKNGCRTDREYLLRTCEPEPHLPLNMIEYCQGVEASPLQALPAEGNTLQWYDSELNPLSDTPVPVTTLAGEQIFYVAQINGTLQCEGKKARVTVLVNPAPVAADLNASAGDICLGNSPSILIEDADERYTYSVYPDNAFDSELSSLTGVTSGTVDLEDVPENSTVYRILVTDNLGCVSTDWKDVAVEVIKLYIEPETLPRYYKNVDYEQILLTNAQSPVFTLIGDLPDGLSLSTSGTISGKVPNSEHSIHNTFTVRVQDFRGCRAVREYTLIGDIFVPKAFTPNGDGINDIFMPENKVVIFDRLGIEIYRGDSGWDGTYKGKPAAADIYFYILEYTDGDGITKTLTGYVGVHY